MSKSIHNKDWDEFIEHLDDETKEKLNDYDHMVYTAQQRPPFMICSSEGAKIINEILNKNE